MSSLFHFIHLDDQLTFIGQPLPRLYRAMPAVAADYEKLSSYAFQYLERVQKVVHRIDLMWREVNTNDRVTTTTIESLVNKSLIKPLCKRFVNVLLGNRDYVT